jgi:hypothetical protein
LKDEKFAKLYAKWNVNKDPQATGSWEKSTTLAQSRSSAALQALTIPSRDIAQEAYNSYTDTIKSLVTYTVSLDGGKSTRFQVMLSECLEVLSDEVKQGLAAARREQGVVSPTLAGPSSFAEMIGAPQQHRFSGSSFSTRHSSGESTTTRLTQTRGHHRARNSSARSSRSNIPNSQVVQSKPLPLRPTPATMGSPPTNVTLELTSSAKKRKSTQDTPNEFYNPYVLPFPNTTQSKPTSGIYISDGEDGEEDTGGTMELDGGDQEEDFGMSNYDGGNSE